ncbi:MAG: hypothetical protein WBW31_11810 [Candidatus Sulfotelmatobacter sp.]
MLTEEKFAELTVSLWRLHTRYAEARKRLKQASAAHSGAQSTFNRIKDEINEVQRQLDPDLTAALEA